MNNALVDLVWTRAHQCCEYCRMPQIFDDIPFEFDHVIAIHHGGKIALGSFSCTLGFPLSSDDSNEILVSPTPIH